MRRKSALAIGMSLTLLSAAPVVARAQDAALLLGQGETTTLIVVHNDSVVARRGAGLIVPRASGWWRVGVLADTTNPVSPTDSTPRRRTCSASRSATRRASAAPSGPHR